MSARIAAGIAAAALVASFAGCRAVVGIDVDALSFPDASADGSTASRAEGDSGEGTKDAGARGPDGGESGNPDTGTPEAGAPGGGNGNVDAASIQCVNNGDFGACMMCCRQDNMTANGSFEMYLRGESCICNGGACTSECATATCANPPGAGGGTTGCPMCIDDLLMGGGCPAAITDCANDPQCKAMAECVTGCK